MTGERRLILAERNGREFTTSLSRRMTRGEVVTLGREAEIVLAMSPPDNRVSRQALTVSATAAGWAVSITNRNGVLVHPWGLPAWQARPSELLTDTRAALRVLGSPDREHWILLENDEAAGAETGGVHTHGQHMSTIRATTARPLTTAQHEVVRLVFADMLAWPPKATAAPGQLKQAARALGISVSAVQERLKAVVAKAVSLGLSREVEVTDPEYVYVLVRAGYLQPDH